jgi:putative flippase GtrA
VSEFVRWLKFNVVGAMGMVVQLVVLAGLNRVSAGHYLWSTVVAIEVAVLHNFVWHLRYTWRDRCGADAWGVQLVRFHLSNGLVSMVGNLLMMRVLVGAVRMPVILANVVAVVCCSVVNFGLGQRWVFAARGSEGRACSAA